MKSMIRSGLITIVSLSALSLSAFAQERTPNTPLSDAVLNADSSSFVSVPQGVGMETVTDGGFEAGSPNPFWSESSTNFGTPLCTVAGCGTGAGTGPHGGEWWAWFGGIDAYEEGSVSQDVTLLNGAATLYFWLEIPVCDTAADYMEVLVDGNQVFVVNGANAACDMVGYVQHSVDLSAFADGGVHTLEFHSEIFGTSGLSNFFVDDVSLLGEEEGTARFRVSKDFDDNNTAEVQVTLSCNTGLPLEQTTTISEGDPVNFVVVDYEPGTLDCEVTEVVPGGYTASYNDGTVSPDNCSYEDVVGGQFECAITNSLNEVDVDVTKVWIDENPQFNASNIASANWLCQNVAGGGNASGSLDFFGSSDTESFSVFPDWDGTTTCSVTEVNVPDGGVEVDDSDCKGLVVTPGSGSSCTIFNTRLFEGIPTLSQYGLAVLALMMLGVGLIGFRRLV